MTTGSWTVNPPKQSDSVLYAEKIWNGDNGKYEVWAGGIRAKWNNYQMSTFRWTQNSNVQGTGDGWPDLPVGTIQSAKDYVGWTDNEDLRVLNKLAEEIKDHAFDLGINIAEAGRTYGLVLSNLRSVGNGLVDLKRGNIAGAFRSLGVPERRRRPLRAKDISGRWLEMQYGWRPLIAQSFEAAKALEAVTKQRKLRFMAKQSKRRLVNFGSPPFYNSWALVDVQTRILAELYEDISFARSMGLTNPAAIAWEVVPYSFVVDWFLPVGSYLSAWGVIPALKGRFLTTTKASVTGDRFAKTSPFPLGRPTAGYGLKRKKFIYSRVASNSLSVPRPTFKSLPSALSPAHLYNAVALVHQRLR
jgi:hypothetical protein